MRDFNENLSEKEAFLLDLDGVVHIDESPISGAVGAVQHLIEDGKKILFLTNNSTKARSEYVEKLLGFGLEVEESDVMTSAYATALYLSENFDDVSCYVLGEEGLEEELKSAGFEIFKRRDAEKASHVVVGMDRGLTYDRIWGGLSALISGADFIATNPDPTYPTQEGLAPGAGASIGALSGASGMEPLVVVGKPSTYIIDASLRVLDVTSSDTAIVGDRIDTDVRAGNRAGLTSVLVTSGVDSGEGFGVEAGEKEEPDYVFPSLSDMVEEMIR